MRKLLAAGLVSLCAVLLWIAWPGGAPRLENADVAAGAGHDRAAAPAAVAATAAEAEVLADEAWAETPEPLRRAACDLPCVGPDPELGATTPYEVTFLVLDDAELPVAGAVVRVWAAEHQTREKPDAGGNASAWLGRREDGLLLELTADADGTCRARLERAMAYADALHPGFGRSVVHAIGRDWLPDDSIVRLWLARPVLVRGLVLDETGSPEPDAVLTILADGTYESFVKRRFLQTGPVVGDRFGRFRFEARTGMPCRIQAEARSRVSMIVRLTVEDGVEVVVPFRGAIGIAGRVLDPRVAPAAGCLVAASTAAEPGAPRRLDAGVSGPDGRFAFTVASLDRYFVKAGVHGDRRLRTAQVSVQPSLHLLRPEIELRLLDPVSITGVVRSSGGAAVADAEVTANERPEVALMLGQSGPYRTRTGADGAFELLMPAECRFDVRADAGERGSGSIESVASGTKDLTVVVEQAPAAGTIRVAVVLDADGAPVEDSELWFIREQERGWMCHKPKDAVRDGSLVVLRSPTVAGCLLGASTRSKRAAPGLVGPLAPGMSGDVTIRLPAWGEVPVRVLGPGGQPARSLRIDVIERGPTIDFRPTAMTDPEGRALLRIVPGPCTLRVGRLHESLAERDVTVVSGPNPEVTLSVRL